MGWKLDKVIDWVLSEGRMLPDLDHVVGGLGKAMLEAEAPIWRIRLAIRTVHPLVTALSSAWERDSGKIDSVAASHGLDQRQEFIGSPLARIAETGRPLRKSLTDLTDADHVAYHELRERGATDYFGLPLRFVGEGGGVLVFVSDRTEGFSDQDIAGFGKIGAAITPIVEVHRLRNLSLAVAEAYLGPRTGRRVVGGQITRGDIDRIEAAILISDIRDWTGLNARLPVEETVALANRYFEVIDAAVTGHGGEILKFIGDGVLAIFPAEPDMRSACRRALSAARAALAAVPQSELRYGVGLHCGSVLYGNIGSEARLDFTVLGQAVNIAARIEALCGTTGQPAIYSQDFAEMLETEHLRLGAFPLKGLDAPAQLFAPVAAEPAKPPTEQIY
ncbi:adenylate/guanylate cyclase domain-containing protein [Ruegeria sediminis]|nr:adenylate/guanylate cyclase domain-containing protein [Ruegeria sediminis]